MAHPRKYEGDDPVLERLRALCLSFPESCEVEAWGRATFRAGPQKLFAVYSDAPADGRPAMVFKPEPGERLALVQDPRFFVPPYFGSSGWLGLTFGTDGNPESGQAPTDWVEVAELVESSYRLVAHKRLVKALDAR